MLSIETSFKGITRVWKELWSIITKISSSVVEMHENRRFFENKSLFLKETHMSWCFACRVQRMLSIETSFVGITRVFKALSSFAPKISWSVGEMHENWGFSENKRLFLKETHLFFCIACRVKRLLSNETSFEWIIPVFKKLTSIATKISSSVFEMHENRRFFENKYYFSKKQTCFCVLPVQFNECYRLTLVLKE